MNKESLREFLLSRNIVLKENSFDDIHDFMSYTLKQNEKFNLTSITDESVFYEKMILDSLLGLYDLDLSHKKVIDIGTGAGYPGMVLYIANRNINMTLLDSTNKKIESLKEYCKANNFDVKTIFSRAESYAKEHIEDFDYAVARAVANLSILLELIIPILKVGGCFICYKGAGWQKEINEAKKAFEKLNCSIKKIYLETLPESKEERAILLIEKNKSTPKKFPRDYKVIKDKPL